MTVEEDKPQEFTILIHTVVIHNCIQSRIRCFRFHTFDRNTDLVVVVVMYGDRTQVIICLYALAGKQQYTKAKGQGYDNRQQNHGK